MEEDEEKAQQDREQEQGVEEDDGEVEAYL